MKASNILADLGISHLAEAGDIAVHSPIDGGLIGRVASQTVADVDAALAKAQEAYKVWRSVPAPRRGELVRLLGNKLRERKQALGSMITLETGKILQEGLGEVQEMIDICDFAVGLSRQLYGLTIASERPGHRMAETWHPMGVCTVISAFNFPAAVWSWNAALALVCGNAVIWKPSEKTPLTALAVDKILQDALEAFGDAPAGLTAVINGGRDVGAKLVADPRSSIVSATGSTEMGRAVGVEVARRFGRSLLELGGNNAGIVSPTADLELALRGILFSAVGTAGQRCTTLRRLFVHESIYDNVVQRLKTLYGKVAIGNPLEQGTLMGPLIDEQSFGRMQAALAQAKHEGGTVFGGERHTVAGNEKGFYVRPAIVEMPSQTDVVLTETFAPILYVLKYRDFSEAVDGNNAAHHGLSSCVFTTDLRESERFLSASGSDCGIANVNIGPSGAEIGGAFGGEKETGGGRESGSDAWKAYMRRATNTVNFSSALPLAQGIDFNIG
ncbi:aldehyde dehydrogenase family protein [Trinickia caryophylli]|uniref:aldehyde dehydrogenase (NAD(+)) n=1 Tax=Trinickia caryophylli TaxID=28094 RepID=A0A1X7ECH7_TRICW|nr:aldehyde dehydrogenase family protein [Trinickia caryophylli]PMS12904.1 aldehyde dehydrogenase family protein [Trinickia caryophylli]TRX14660.1 aldehyde dehydrogenase family protein [Trinickia caryophylli]WQE14504.1 aldehyde dehydrogenase family protein [Trinickia caryophylli]SMF31618.1 aldehyde dehydrogenase (NAD+) [Trinickia caryophylli]GLU32091.1 aldehyde dehydrogenase [Trinickia caryophylli]